MVKDHVFTKWVTETVSRYTYSTTAVIGHGGVVVALQDVRSEAAPGRRGEKSKGHKDVLDSTDLNRAAVIGLYGINGNVIVNVKRNAIGTLVNKGLILYDTIILQDKCRDSTFIVKCSLFRFLFEKLCKILSLLEQRRCDF